MTVPYLRDALARGPVLGTFLKLPRPEVVDVLAAAGFDFAVCDYEHAQMDERDVREVIRAGRTAGLPITVRVPDLERGLINRLLEAGAAGIQLARTRRTAARELRDVLRYPPDGSRSISTSHPVADYGRVPLTELLPATNEAVLAIGQFETADYADELDATLDLLDVAFIGPVDLRVSLGHPGDPDHPDVTTAIDTIRSAAIARQVPAGIFVGSATAARAAVEAGYTYVVVAGDLTLLANAAAEVTGRGDR